ncbi:UbiA family prenyltransferase [Thermococcus sp. 5-4]|uniref:UbiA family prenyltransferase n=1 Tax=Thermococcus sp. 5-4 TaxID=2008440 RepID=UPI001D039195|nr:UbiA family prenyltransferase [Thermococcus sp. 5-4]
MRLSFDYTRYSQGGGVGNAVGSGFGLVLSLFNFLISTSVFLAASGVFKLCLSFLLYGVAPRWNLLAATFLLVFSVYGINKLTDIKEDEVNNPERVGYVKRVAKALKYAVVLSLVLAVLLSALTSPLAVLVVLFPIVAGALYSIRLLPGYPRLKDITGVKNLIIAVTWANGTAFLPYLVAGGVALQKVALIYYFFFMKSMINTILFDVRDIEGDRINGIQTIPVKLGLEKSRALLLLLNSTFIPWIVAAHSLGYFGKYMPVLAFAILNGYAYILYFARRNYRPGKVLDVWVDGEWFYTLPLAMVI